MKALQELCQSVGVPLKVQYYLSYLDQAEIAVITKAVHQKAQRYQWNLLRLLALKILRHLKTSALLSQEASFQKLSADAEAALLVGGTDRSLLRHALQAADRLIVSVWAIRAIYPNGGGAPAVAHNHPPLWSASQDRQYVAVREAYLAHNAVLTALDTQVNRCKARFLQTAGVRSAAKLSSWKSVPPHFPEGRLDYRPEACEIHLSEENIFRFLQAEKKPRVAYRYLTAKLMKKPTGEVIRENMHAAKLFLHYKSESILHNVAQLRGSIVEETQQRIEHRTQVKLAHVKKLENLSMAFENLIRLLASYRLLVPPSAESQACQGSKQRMSPLSRWLTEAKTLQTALEEAPLTLTAALLEEKLLRWEAYRKEFARSIATGWSTFFYADRRARRQHEQQLNVDLQSALATCVMPLYGFHEHAKLLPPEQIKQPYAAVSQLDEQSAAVTLEQQKVEKIKNTF
jgi:hypothetical protein